MRPSDIMSHMNLTTYPIAGLVIFLAVFAAVSARALSRRHAGEYRRAASMPLDDDQGPPATEPAPEGRGQNRGVRP